MKSRWTTLVLFAASAFAMAADMSIQQAQEILKAKGYYSGEVDGINGPLTEAALVEFQKAQGIKLSGTLDDRTAKQLNASMPEETLGTMKGAGKEAGSSATSEFKSALDEMKSVFKGGKK